MREIAHRGLGRVDLPVSVGGERCRGVEGGGRGYAGEMLRIPRQQGLGPFDDVGQQQRDEAEDQQRDGVLLPTHLLIGVDAAGAVEQTLDGPQHGIEKGLFPFEHAGDVKTQGPHQEQQHGKEHDKLQPAIGGHTRISPDTTA